MAIEARALIDMFHYYRYMWSSWSHILSPLKEATSGPKGVKLIRNDKIEDSFKEIKYVVSADTLLNCPD